MISIKIINQADGSEFEVLTDQIGALEGWEYPQVKNVVEDVFGEPGAVYVTSSFGRRRFSYISYLVNQCDDDRRAMLKVLRQTGSQKLLEFTTLDNLALQAYVDVLKVLHPYTALQKPFLIELIAADYRFYSQTLNTEVVAVNDVEAIDNAGTAPTSPIFRITGPGTNIEVINNETSESFAISSLSAGQVLEVDSLNHTVRLDTVDDFSLWSGDFFDLQPGENNIGFNVQSGSDGNTELEIVYRDAYDGV